MTILPSISPQASLEPTPPGIGLAVRDLGRMAYAPALELQRQFQQNLIARRIVKATGAATGAAMGTEPGGDGGGMTLLLVEHDPPVITISRRPGVAQHLTATAAQLARAGVEVAQTDRGGDITYHGPGQLVVYPILDHNLLGLRINSYMRLLEQIVIDTLAHFGIEGKRDEHATGVWVADGGSSTAKICAMGVRVSRWVSMHGLALNVMPDLDHFNLIVPCGLVGRGVTSMRRMLAERCPMMDEVKGELTRQFHQTCRSCAGSIEI